MTQQPNQKTINSKKKILASLALLGTVAAVAALFGTQQSEDTGNARLLQQVGELSVDLSPDDIKAFQTFMQKNNRNYLTKEEHSARLKIFKANLDLVRAHDAVATGFKIGINKFSDLSLEEFEKMQGFRQLPEINKFLDEDDEDDQVEPTNKTEGPKGRGLQDYEDSIDWRQKGVLTPIRNQGSCGGCYTFSTVCAIEAAYKIQTGNLVSFSEQQILDCSTRYGNSGCGGGLMTNSFKYLQSAKLTKRDDYPYTGV